MSTSIDLRAPSVRPGSKLPPGPPHPLFGLGMMNAVQHDFLGFLDNMASYGDLSYTPLGYLRWYQINHPDLIHEAFITQADKLHKWRVQKKVIGQVIDKGTFNIDGEHWKRQRKLVQPAFHFKRIAAYLETMVEETSRLLDSWQVGHEYNMLTEMPKATMAIICRTMFGAEVYGNEDVLSRELGVCLHTEAEQMQALVRLPAWLPTTKHRAFQHAIKTLDDLIYGFIQARRASGEDTGDLLSMLLLAADEDHGGTMTDKEVRDEALTIFSAGHETTATALTFAWALLAQNPEVEAKLTEEVTRVLGDRPPTLETLRAMPYLEMVVKETLRLHPPAFGTLRQPIEDMELGGYKIPKGSLIGISQHTMHRDPRYWEQPNQFMPERFSPEREKSITRYTYFPFGVGPHICTGQALAMMEVQVILALTIQRYRLSPIAGQAFQPEVVFLQRPVGGVRMVVESRRN